MKTLILSGNTTGQPMKSDRIYCPAMQNLTAEQADLAFVMPRMDHNRTVLETEAQGDWAALLACDPFGSEIGKFAGLVELGYTGIANWPSAILLDGSLRESMLSVPASAESEYEFLARAKSYGFDTLAFFISLTQARSALKAGLTRLVLHPGLLEIETPESRELVLRSLAKLIDDVKSEAEEVSIFVYSSQWHESRVPLSSLQVDGIVWCEVEE